MIQMMPGDCKAANIVLCAQLQEHVKHYAVILTQLTEERQQLLDRHRQRYWWVWPWIERPYLFGQYNTIFKELVREFSKDYLSYILMDSNLFVDLVTPWITKGPRFVNPHHAMLEYFYAIFLFLLQ